MNNTLLPASDHTLGMDYKQFIRQFESYRQAHPASSFQQAMDAFMLLHQQNNQAEKGSQ